MSYDDGALPSDQLQILLKLLVKNQPRIVLEIGTFMGTTTAAIAEALPNAVVHTIDLPLGASVPDEAGKDAHLVQRRIVGRDYVGRACSNRIVQHLCNTLTDFPLMPAPDFVFIDADHSYEGCRNDSEKALALVAHRSATFVWHDCDATHPGVVQLLHEWRHAFKRDIRKIADAPLAYWKKL